MPDEDPTEFTDREKFILAYYRVQEASGTRRGKFYDVVIGVASLAAVILFVTGGETAYGIVGYGLLFGRFYYLVSEGGRWSRDFRSIFAKYDAKLKKLTEAQKGSDGGGGTS